MGEPPLMSPRPVSLRFLPTLPATLIALLASAGASAQSAREPGLGALSIAGRACVWHPLTFTFHTAVDTHETAHPAGANPFLDHRLTVTFTHPASGTSYAVPGFYAADGRAADTSAAGGGAWQVHFTPDRAGGWNWTASFRRGANIAIEPGLAGTPADSWVDGRFGTLEIAPADPSAPGFLGAGRLEYVGERYFRFAESGERYLKNGSGGPENLLAFYQVDGTVGDPVSLCLVPPANPERLHRYAPHAGDFHGDELDLAHTWGSPPRGQNLLGAINYLASVGVNSAFFSIHGYRGDSNDIWPWVSATDKRHYDASKLAQWERVFAHMTARGVQLQVVLDEAENDQLNVPLGLGYGLTIERRLYYREIVARFAHHPAVMWIVGEESNYYDDTAVMQAMALEIRALDPYDHPIAFHSKHPCSGSGCPQEYPTVFGQYEPYFEFEGFEASAFQTVPGGYNNSTLQMIAAQSASRAWAHFGDEQSLNALPTNLADNRRRALWGNLMAGGSGVAWYPGNAIASQYPPGYDLCDYYDVSIEDLRLLQDYFLQTGHALRFFREQLPFAEMSSANYLASPRGAQDYVYYRPEEGATGVRAVYAVYRSTGSATNLTLGSGTHTVQWFNPRTGAGPIAAPALLGPGAPQLPPPAQDPGQDWLAIVRQQ
jgi:hypothetical protein